MKTLKQLNSIIDKAITKLDWDKEPERLYKPLEYMLSIGGKRLRPRFCLTAYNLFSDKIDDSIILPALSLEVFHSFTLIHDDIMDKASLRRGQKTVYKKWNSDIAILSGDAMCIDSYVLLANAPWGKLHSTMELFCKTALQVCEGQQYDMDFEYMKTIKIEDYMKMIALKTGVLIACSAKLGALIAGAPESICDGLYKFGLQLGLAFQIQDDYLDSFGDEKVFGKRIGGDILNNKKTWLLVNCYNIANSKKKKDLCKLLMMPESAGKKKISKIRQFFEDMGVKDNAEKAIADNYNKALETLERLELNAAQKAQMTKYANTLITRIK
ncbi:MAG: polyprenyl synthetase family protein [Bacteroidales bacterium]|nr:polyprenyl synthetase family protein [Bacteroidales bacterium]MDD4420340.1 polyprenyl synthetase family protein [Bacteroidales bacterium]